MLTLLAQTADRPPEPLTWPEAVVFLGVIAAIAWLFHCMSR
jgi:hypothetical protein